VGAVLQLLWPQLLSWAILNNKTMAFGSSEDRAFVASAALGGAAGGCGLAQAVTAVVAAACIADTKDTHGRRGRAGRH
jgi:nitrous oxide reductase